MKAKVCGVACPEDLAFVLASGADFIGFLHHEPSPRHCADLRLASLAGERAVLVAPVREIDEMLGLADRAGTLWVQPYFPLPLRGKGVEALLKAGRRVLLPWPDEAGNLPIWADGYVWECSPLKTGVLGGSGRAHAMLHPPPGPFFLAGGLCGEGVASRGAALPLALRERLLGFDAASLLEDSPGRKSEAKVRGFVQAVRQFSGEIDDERI